MVTLSIDLSRSPAASVEACSGSSCVLSGVLERWNASSRTALLCAGSTPRSSMGKLDKVFAKDDGSRCTFPGW